VEGQQPVRIGPLDLLQLQVRLEFGVKAKKLQVGFFLQVWILFFLQRFEQLF
jgi:hypothetical protein